MPVDPEWKLLRDAMVTLDKRVKNGAVVVGDAAQWEIPANIDDPTTARAYLESVFTRLQDVQQAVDAAYNSPIERVQQAGHEVASRAVAIAKRSARIAHKVANDMADNFEKMADSLMKGGENIAAGLGMGAAFALIVGLLLLARTLGK